MLYIVQMFFVFFFLHFTSFDSLAYCFGFSAPPPPPPLPPPPPPQTKNIHIFRNIDCTTFYYGYLFSFTLRVPSYFYRSLSPIFHGPVFCPVCPTVSNMKASYFGYLFSLALSMTSYYLEVTVTYVSWSSDFALNL